MIKLNVVEMVQYDFDRSNLKLTRGHKWYKTNISYDGHGDNVRQTLEDVCRDLAEVINHLPTRD